MSNREAESLTATAVQQALQTAWLGRNYYYYPSVSSTNDLLKEAARCSGAAAVPAGTVYLTDYQESGRGRMARRWHAPPGTSLLFSVLLRQEQTDAALSWLPLLAGLAVAEGVEAVTALPVRLKWPNDLVLETDGRWHKFCGILLESDFQAQRQPGTVIIGIGINVNLSATELPQTTFPATSLMIASGGPQSRLQLLAAILSRLEFHLDEAARGQTPQPAWQARLIMLGQEVHISRPGHAQDLIGTTEGTDAAGQLLVRDRDGRLHSITAGDVSLRLRGSS